MNGLADQPQLSADHELVDIEQDQHAVSDGADGQ